MPLLRSLTLTLLLLPATLLAAQDSTARRVENQVAGISITRPSNWQVASQQLITENRSRVQMSNAELQDAVQKYARAPLVAFMKYPDGHPTINPTIQIAARPSTPVAGMAATDALGQVAAALQAAFPDYTFITPIEKAEVSGLPAAYMKGRYTLKNDGGQEFKVTARMWIVIRGETLFIIGMSGPQEGADLSEAEFTEALKSIVIQK